MVCVCVRVDNLKRNRSRNMKLEYDAYVVYENNSECLKLRM